MGEEKLKQKEVEQQFYQEMLGEREQEKEIRDHFRKDAAARVAAERTNYKEKLNEQIEARNKYRDKIILRNEKMRALTDLLGQEKIDLNAL